MSDPDSRLPTQRAVLCRRPFWFEKSDSLRPLFGRQTAGVNVEGLVGRGRCTFGLVSPARIPPLPDLVPKSEISIDTLPQEQVLELIRKLAERCSLTLVPMDPVKDQFWASILACLKTPRGGMNGGGSMHCSFEFIAASEAIVKHVMEDLPLMPNKRYNLSTPKPHWEDSPTINTYTALDTRLIDSFFRLHRRPAARGLRVYRGSVLLNPPDTYPDPVCQLSAAPPFNVELCHRKHHKLVLAVNFNVCLLNDQNFHTMSPSMPDEEGMDDFLHTRALNHLKKMASNKNGRCPQLFLSWPLHINLLFQIRRGGGWRRRPI